MTRAAAVFAREQHALRRHQAQAAASALRAAADARIHHLL